MSKATVYIIIIYYTTTTFFYTEKKEEKKFIPKFLMWMIISIEWYTFDLHVSAIKKQCFIWMLESN